MTYGPDNVVMAEEMRSEQEQEAIATFLREVNKDRAESGSSPVGTSTATMFLIARKFNAERAVTLYRQYQNKRHLYYLQAMAPYDEPLRSELLSGKFTVLNARDSGGAAIAVFTAKDHFPAASSHQTIIQSIAFQLDESLRSHETQKNGLVLVYDMTESGYNNFDYGLARKVLALLKGAYPARLKNVFIVSPPMWFKAILSFFANFIQEKLRERLEIIPKEVLPHRLPESSIPESLGGTLKVDHLAWLNKCLASFSPCAGENDIDHYGEMGISSTFNRVKHVGQFSSEVEESPLDEQLGLSNEGAMSVIEFLEHMIKKTKKGIKDEYSDLKRESVVGSFESSRLPVNLRKNRYTDVPCVEHSRVKLSEINGDVSTTYIHANYMDGYKQDKAYIATQGPLPNTKGDFWRMVWEQHVLVIVMVTRCIERSRRKCIQYWPEKQQTEEFAMVLVTHQETLEFEDHVERLFQIKHKMSGETRQVVHFQMTSWPDFGVPSSAESCLHVVGLVRQAQRDAVQNQGFKWRGHPNGPPILVHCSAGIGRTGTFCTIDINVARLTDIGKCEVYNTVKEVRAQRVFTIQTVEQYEFCHLAILEQALTMPKTTGEEHQAVRDFLEGWRMQQQNCSDSD